MGRLYPDYTILHFTDGMPDGGSSDFYLVFEVMAKALPDLTVFTVLYNINERTARYIYDNTFNNNDYVLIKTVNEFSKISESIINDRILKLTGEG